MYKGGRDPRDEDLGIADPAVSGARLGRSGAAEQICVREGIVLDFDVFGEGINDGGCRRKPSSGRLAKPGGESWRQNIAA